MRFVRITVIFLTIVFLVGLACDCGTNDDTNGNGNGDPPIGTGDYFLSANIGNLTFSDGSFQLEVCRLDSSISTGANEATVTLNGESVPLLTGNVEDAVFLKNHIGFEADKAYTVVVTLATQSATCNLTVGESWGTEISSPADDSPWTPGDAINITWTYVDGAAPDSVEVVVDDEVDESDEYDYVVYLSGSSTSHTVPGSATSDLEGMLWVRVCPLTDIWWFTGDLQATGSFVTQVYACDAITLIEADSSGPGSIEVYAYPAAIPADGATTSDITAYVYDAIGGYVPDGTTVNFATDRGTLSSPTATTLYGEATVSLTSTTTPGTATVTATCGELCDDATVEFEEIIDVVIAVGAGDFPSISWTPSSEVAYALNVGAIGVVIPKWSIGSILGFNSPVTFGTVPSGATQAIPMAGSPAALVNGTEYRISLVTAGDDTTFYTFVR